MTSSPASPSIPVPGGSPQRSDPLRWFYSAAAVLMLVLAATGFHHFYFEGRSYPGRPITPPISGIVIAHGLAMAAWIVLMIVQPMLIATGRRRVHMALGRAGAVLAAAIVALGFVVATMSAAVAPPGTMFGPFTSKQFMSVPYTGVLMFGVYVAIGVWKRSRPQIHRPMMFLATLAALPAALDRIDAVRDLYSRTVLYVIWGPFFSALVLGAVLLAVRCALARSFDRWFAAGLAGLAVVFGVMVQVAFTPAWDRFASMILS